ncbi:MAG: DUF3108 domain-containing protein [Stellaceae bacterium]
MAGRIEAGAGAGRAATPAGSGGVARTALSRRIVLAAIAVIAAGLLVPKAGQAKSLTAFYRVSWGGFPAADLVLRFDRDGRAYRDAVRIKTVGPARWLTHFRATAHAEGMIGGDGTIEPARYRMIYNLHHRRRKRQMLDFVARDGARIADYGVGDSGHKRERLAEIYRRNVLDPLSALSRVREILWRGPIRAGEHFTLPVFDDTRRTAARFTVESAGGGGRPVRLHLELRTIASYKLLHRHRGRDDDDTTREIELRLSGDGRLLPLSISADVAVLPLTARFDHLCVDFAHCGPGAAPPKSN